MIEIDCHICGETYLTNEAIEIEHDGFRCSIYLCPKCRKELLVKKENEK